MTRLSIQFSHLLTITCTALLCLVPSTLVAKSPTCQDSRRHFISTLTPSLTITAGTTQKIRATHTTNQPQWQLLLMWKPAKIYRWFKQHTTTACNH